MRPHAYDVSDAARWLAVMCAVTRSALHQETRRLCCMKFRCVSDCGEGPVVMHH
jgi:hypothetical protein